MSGGSGETAIRWVAVLSAPLTTPPVEFKVELKEPEPKPFPSQPVGTGTFNLERSTHVSRTRPRRR